jgi:hypothetical protein
LTIVSEQLANSPQVGAQYNFDPKKYSNGANYLQTTVVRAIFPRCRESTMLNINSEADARCKGNGVALLTVDSTDERFRQIYNLVWQRC